MTDLQKLSDTMRDWSTTAGDHHWQAHLAIQELIQVKAQVEVLRKAIIDATNNGAVTDSGRWVYSIDTSVLDATPAQCLAEIKAQAVEDAIKATSSDKYRLPLCDVCDLYEYANQLRQQAKAGE